MDQVEGRHSPLLALALAAVAASAALRAGASSAAINPKLLRLLPLSGSSSARPREPVSPLARCTHLLQGEGGAAALDRPSAATL